MRGGLVVALLALAACAPKTETAVVAPPVVQEKAAPVTHDHALPAPAPAGVTQRITAADNGKTIIVPDGGRFSVQLVGVPTAGYLWSVTAKPAFLGEAVESGGNTTSAQAQPGFVGGNHWEVFTFQATEAGEGKLVLEQRRPWEKNEPPAQTFSVNIRVF